MKRDDRLSNTLHALLHMADFAGPMTSEALSACLRTNPVVVRRTMAGLRDMGLVSIVPQAGTYVFSPTADDVRTMSQFRALLETEALAEATKRRPDVVQERLQAAIAAMNRAVEAHDWDAYRRADSRYHMAFMEESGNRFFARAYQLTAPALEALRVRLQAGPGNFREQSYREHVEIAAMLKDGRIKPAASLLRYHILVINDSLHTLPLVSTRSSRKDKGDDRDYSAVFGARSEPLPTA